MSKLRMGMVVGTAAFVAACGTDPRPYSTFLLDKEPATQLAAFETTPCSVYFDLDSAAIRPDQAPVLDGCAKYFNEKAALGVVLEGHADERGSDAYNLKLGESRAKAVAAELGKRGVAVERVTVTSHGEEKTAGEESAWSKARRVDMAQRKS